MNKLNRTSWIALGIFGVLAGLGFAALQILRSEEALYFVKAGIYWDIILPIGRKSFLNPLFLPLIAGILIIEKIYPVNPQQKTFSVGFIQDMGWLVFALIFEAVIVSAYVSVLQGMYHTHLHFIKASAIAIWPDTLRFIWGALLADFFSYFQHWLKHKISLFWEFHAVHHSQKEMNMFTDFRFHFMEYFISRSISVIPMVILAVDRPKIVAYTVFITWLTRFYHANIKMNFGPLRYILVTPQSHRIHHSIEPQHQDKNFGLVFSIWDWLFGTQYKNADVYPETGIADQEFPLEMETSFWGVLVMGYRQTLFPFFKIAKWFGYKEDGH